MVARFVKARFTGVAMALHWLTLILVVANLSKTVQPVSLDLSAFAGWTPTEMSGGVDLPPVSAAPYFLTLGPHAFYWLQLRDVTGIRG